MAAALLSLVLAACGGGDSPPPPDRTPSPSPRATATAPPAQPALCGDVAPRVVGTVDPAAGAEISGLALARDGTLWAHNDSGGTPQVFALSRTGALEGAVTLLGAANADWEDIAVRGTTLYVGDIGDNAAQRADVAVYRVADPPPTTASVPATRLTLRYEDGAHDAEALLVDPRTATVVIVTKDYGGVAGVYVAGDDLVLRRRAELSLGIGQAITAGDVSADGRTIVLRSYDRAFVFTKARRTAVATALREGPACTVGANLLDEGQGESLAITRDGRAFYTVPEGAGAPLRRYARRR